MKTLIVIRHAKSTWELQVRDHDRVLTQKGIDNAHAIGKALNNKPIKVDAVWTSTAARALQTATIVTEYLDYNLQKLILKRELYTFESKQLLNVITSCDDAVNTLAIFSHNHGITDLVNSLGSTHFDNVPTAGVVAITFNTTSWTSIGKGTTQFNIFPKSL